MNVELEISWDFYLDPPVADPETLHNLGEKLMIELLKLEECNSGVTDSGTATDSQRGVVTVELMVCGTSFARTLQKTLDLVRTAIHAVGGATPDWPTARQIVVVMLRPGEMTATPTNVRELQDA